MKANATRERIIVETIHLIKESNGLIENITIRKIAEKANVGIGLVNHYFGSKEKLIEECVQKIISGVIGAFHPVLIEGENSLESTKRIAKEVMHFLMDHPQISKISIIGDLRQPGASDNTTRTIHGFGVRLAAGTIQDIHKIKAFMITAVLQEAFLRKDVLLETLGVDFYNKIQRDLFIDELIERFQ